MLNKIVPVRVKSRKLTSPLHDARQGDIVAEVDPDQLAGVGDLGRGQRRERLEVPVDLLVVTPPAHLPARVAGAVYKKRYKISH